MSSSGRSRLVIRRSVQAAAGEIIDAIIPLPFNATLLQIIFKYSATPAPADTVHFGKDSGIGAALTINKIREFEVGLDGTEQGVCNEHFEYPNGDSLILYASNAGDIGVSMEAIFEEAG